MQSANSSGGIKSLQGVDVCVCVCTHSYVRCGSFLCHWSFTCPIFLVQGSHTTKKTRTKKVPTLHTNISHSHRLAAEGGKKSGSDQRRVKSVD